MAFVHSATLPRTGLSSSSTPICTKPSTVTPAVIRTLDIQAAKHAQFKGAKKHDRLRPKKHRPSDINRKPPPYDTEPLLGDDIPPIYTIIKAADVADATDATESAEATEVVAEAAAATEVPEVAEAA